MAKNNLYCIYWKKNTSLKAWSKNLKTGKMEIYHNRTLKITEPDKRWSDDDYDCDYDNTLYHDGKFLYINNVENTIITDTKLNHLYTIPIVPVGILSPGMILIDFSHTNTNLIETFDFYSLYNLKIIDLRYLLYHKIIKPKPNYFLRNYFTYDVCDIHSYNIAVNLFHVMKITYNKMHKI